MEVRGRQSYAHLAGNRHGSDDLRRHSREPLCGQPQRHAEVDLQPIKFPFFSSPAIGADGTIYVSASYYSIGTRENTGRLYAVHADGTQKWQFATPHPLPYSPAISADGTIYAGSTDFNLYAVNPDGTQKWKFTASKGSPGQGPSGLCSSPSIGADGTIYVGSWNYNLYAVKPDGTLKWKFAAGNPVFSSPAISSDGTIYFGSGNDRHLYAANPDGTLKWKFTTGVIQAINSSPAIGADGTVYFGSDDGNLYAVGAAVGSRPPQ